MNLETEQRILKIHQEDSKLGPAGISRQLFAEGLQVTVQDVRDVLTKHGKYVGGS